MQPGQTLLPRSMQSGGIITGLGALNPRRRGKEQIEPQRPNPESTRKEGAVDLVVVTINLADNVTARLASLPFFSTHL